MRKAARAIVIDNDNLLVMHRNKFGSEYSTLPGGAIDMGETAEAAAIREIKEETSIDVANPRLVFIEHAGDMYGDQYIFLCEYVSGEPKLSEDTHEYAINQMGQNLYEPKWLPLGELPNVNFVSEELKSVILRCVYEGWPQEPQEFSSQRRI